MIAASPEADMACYGVYYAITLLRHAIDFAEIEDEFIPLLKWANEVEQSGHELEEMDNQLTHSVCKVVSRTTLQTVASGALSPEDALIYIRYWFNYQNLLSTAPGYTLYSFACHNCQHRC